MIIVMKRLKCCENDSKHTFTNFYKELNVKKCLDDPDFIAFVDRI